MVTPGKKHGYDCRNEKPPFLPALAEEESQHKKEDGDCSKVHRTGGEWLRTPIERERLHCFLKMRLAGTLEEFSGLGIKRQLS